MPAYSASTDEQKRSWAHAVLSDQDLADMVTFLADPRFQASHRESPQAGQRQRNQHIRDDVERFRELWQELEEVSSDIVQQPSEVIELKARLNHVGEPLVLNAQVIQRNILEGRLQYGETGWQLTEPYLWAEQEFSSIDTSENAYLLRVWQKFEDQRETLATALEAEQREFAKRIQQRRDEELHEEAAKAEKAEEKTVKRLSLLSELEPMTFPSEWAEIRSAPTRETNRVRFDERYQRVSQLEHALDDLQTGGISANERKRIAELGQRRPWEIYEFWVVAKVCELLEFKLKFKPHDRRGFLSLVNYGKAEYGLGGTLVYRHESLAIQLEVQQQADGQRPDVRLTLVDGVTEPALPLILDAKCKNFKAAYPSDAAEDLQESARRYTSRRGIGFLIHPGELQAWPARKGKKQLTLPLQAQDYPLRHGIEVVNLKDDRMLSKIFTAWLVRNGIFWICFHCGHNLKNVPVRYIGDSTGLNLSHRHMGYRKGEKFPRFSYSCPECGTSGVLRFCGDCAKVSDRWEPIYQHVPMQVLHDASKAVSNQEWADVYEIMHPVSTKSPMRHCANCGASE